MKGPCLEPPVFALAHHPLHVFVRDLEILQQRAFEVVDAIGILGHLLHPLQRQPNMTVSNRVPKRLRPAEISVRELLDIPHTQFLSAHGNHEVFDLLFFHSVHAHELPQRVHVRVNRKASAEDLVAHLFAHLADQTQSHAHPRFAARQLLRNLRHGHLVRLSEFVDKSRLLEDAERSVVGGPQKIHDAQSFISSQRGVRRPPNPQLASTAVAFESVEQYDPLFRIDPLQWLLDAALRNGGKQPRLERRIPHPVALVPQIQCRKLHFPSHVEPYGARWFKYCRT